MKNQSISKKPSKPFVIGRFPGFSTIALLFFLYVYVPLIILVVFSFNAGNSATIWSEFGLGWYIKAFANADNPNFSAILMREMASGGVNMPVLAREQMQRILFQLGEILKLGESQKRFKHADTIIIHFMILGAINLFVTSAPLRRSLPETDQCNQLQNSDIEFASEQVSNTIISALQIN